MFTDRPNIAISFDASIKYLLLVLVPLGFSAMLIASLPLTFIIMAIALLLLLLVMRQRAGLYLLILFIPMSGLQLKTNIFGMYLARRFDVVIHYCLYHPLLVIVLSLWVFKRLSGVQWQDVENTSSHNTNKVILFSLACWATTTMAWAPDIIFSGRHLLQLYMNIGLFFLPIALIRDEKTVKWTVIFWIIAGVIMSIGAIGDRIYVLYNPVDQTTIKEFKYKIADFLKFNLMFRLLPVRASGFSSFDFTSLLMNITAPLTLFLIDKNKIWYKMVGIAALLVILFARTLIMNKSGLGAFIFAFILLIAFYKSFDRKRIFIFVFIGIVCAMLFLSSQSIFSKISSIKRISSSSGTDKTSSLTIRLKWWKAGIENVIQTNGAGLGPGGFKHDVNAPHGAHNFILSFFFDYGLIGLVCAIFFYLNILRDHFITFACQETEMQRISFLFVVGIAAFMLQGLVDFDYYYPEEWIYLGTSFAILNVAYGAARNESPT